MGYRTQLDFDFVGFAHPDAHLVFHNCHASKWCHVSPGLAVSVSAFAESLDSWLLIWRMGDPMVLRCYRQRQKQSRCTRTLLKTRHPRHWTLLSKICITAEDSNEIK